MIYNCVVPWRKKDLYNHDRGLDVSLFPNLVGSVTMATQHGGNKLQNSSIL